MKDVIKTLSIEWKSRSLPEVKDRNIDLTQYLSLGNRKVIAVTGFRRVGKTYLLFGLIKKLLKEKTKEQVVYINFEDERIPLRTEFLSLLLPGIRQFSSKEVEYLLLDEVQNIPNWGKWLRRICDTEGINLFVSGSSSKMSSMEIPTELRGRFLEVKVFPLSFRELLKFKNLDFDVEHTSHSENEKARILHVLEEYLKYGGLPEIVLSPEDKKHEIANSYYQTVVRRDIIERNRVKNEETLKALMRLLLNSTSYSVSKLYNTLKSLNYAIGKTTLQQYIAHIEQSYFAFSVPIFSYKIKDRLLYPRKIYFIDTIFINLFSTKFSKNYGKTYENTVAVELKRNLKYNEEIYYWKSGNSEVDFVVEQNAKIRQLIQVCYDVSDITTKERETRALIKASKELKCSKLAIITEDYENEELISWFGTEKKIKFIPLWKWLLTTR